MKELRYTLSPDGSSDIALIPILTWLLRQNGVQCAIQEQFMPPDRIGKRPDKSMLSPLAWRIRQSLENFPCDVLFVHRDAEKEPPANRFGEIQFAVEELRATVIMRVVCVVPVRMQEAWLLFDEAAIRYASGNKNGKMPLDIPSLKNVENLANPKVHLRDLLKAASGLSSRRYREVSAQRVVEFIDDFAPLRELPAFQTLETEIRQKIQKISFVEA